jgi:pimeloyl-ACP methyl ester carboxylesterase
MEMCRKTLVAGICGLLALSASLTLGSPPAISEGCFNSGGTQIYYLDVGEGEPVIVLHGFAMTFGRPLIAERLAEVVGSSYRLIAPHLRGHGRSDTPHDPESYGIAMVEDIVLLLDELGIGSAHIIGHSFGGLIALKLSTLYPDRVNSLVIAGIGWLGPSQNLGLTEVVAITLENEASLKPLLSLLASNPEQLSSLQAHIDGTDTKALAACIRSTQELILTEEQLKSNQTPTLAVIGDRDPFRSSVEVMRGVKPNLTVLVVSGSGHSAAAAPDSLRSIKGFIESNPA